MDVHPALSLSCSSDSVCVHISPPHQLFACFQSRSHEKAGVNLVGPHLPVVLWPINTLCQVDILEVLVLTPT